VVQERYERLVALVDQIALEENQRQVGRVVEVLVAEGEGRKDDVTARLSGRAPDNRLVHFRAPDADSLGSIRPGDVANVEVTYGAPHHLVADGPVRALRPTRAGDAWAARQAHPAPVGVALGMPTVGQPV
jgi:tRNA-2-methylthio-N6-dimethylallyladenosine synthase